jgi:hypothetical protein
LVRDHDVTDAGVVPGDPSAAFARKDLITGGYGELPLTGEASREVTERDIAMSL